MGQIQRQDILNSFKEHWRKRYMLDMLLAFMAAILLMFLIVTLPFHPRLATILLVYLFVVLWLIHKRGPRTGILTALIGCAVLDFLVVPPVSTFYVTNIEDGWEILTFLLFVIVFGFSYSRLQKRIEKAKQQTQEDNRLYEEKLRQHLEEVNRRDHEMDIFFEVVQHTRDTKDLTYQLGYIGQAIEEAYSECGVRSCVFILANGDGKPLPQRLSTQLTPLSALSADEEVSVPWVIKFGESVTLPNIPLVFRPKGSYLRRAVPGNSDPGQSGYGYSYLVPLKSEQRVIGVLRLAYRGWRSPAPGCYQKHT